MTPPVIAIDQSDTARLIPSKYSPDEASVLTRIADDDQHLDVIFGLDSVVNDRLKAEADLLPGIAATELIMDAPYASVINAAFCHASPTGARFNGPDRGAWYAAINVETSLAEVGFHHGLWLQETGHFYDSVTYDTYLADFYDDFHDIRDQALFADCCDPDDYRPAQSLAATLFADGATGIVYSSARAPGDCLVCFRPKAVKNVRRSTRHRLTWSGQTTPDVVQEV